MRSMMIALSVGLFLSALALSTPVSAESSPAFVNMRSAGECNFGWMTAEDLVPNVFFGAPNFVHHNGEHGIAVSTHGGVSHFTCHGTVDYGGPASEGSRNFFFGGPLITTEGEPATMASQAQVCATGQTLGFGDAFCPPNGESGATIVHGEDVGLTCSFDGSSTLDWTIVAAPSGMTTMSCRFPAEG